jgi:hypothetical protein
MDQNSLRLNLQKAEAELGMLKIRLASLVELLKAARLELVAAKNELKRCRKACLPARVWRWVIGFYPKGVK